MAQQTAVDWLINELAKKGLLVTKDVDNLVAYKQAKRLEKEQIKKAAMAFSPFRFTSEVEQYYTETYGTRLQNETN